MLIMKTYRYLFGESLRWLQITNDQSFLTQRYWRRFVAYANYDRSIHESLSLSLCLSVSGGRNDESPKDADACVHLLVLRNIFPLRPFTDGQSIDAFILYNSTFIAQNGALRAIVVARRNYRDIERERERDGVKSNEWRRWVDVCGL